MGKELSGNARKWAMAAIFGFVTLTFVCVWVIVIVIVTVASWIERCVTALEYMAK